MRRGLIGSILGVALTLTLAAGPIVADATPAASSETTARPDLSDDMRDVPEVDGQSDATSGAARTPSSRAAAPQAHLVYVSVVDAVAGSSGDLSSDALSQANAEGAIAALNTYWSGETNGAVTFSLAGYETRSYSAASCEPNSIAARQAGTAFGGSFDDYDWVGSNRHLLTLTRETALCGNQAFGTVGGRGGEIFNANGLSGPFALPVLFHEFGHNLGFGHADVSMCTNGRQDGHLSDFAYTDAACPTIAYGDALDIMGFTVANATPHLSAIERIQFGVFGGAYHDASISGGAGTVLVSPLSATTGTRAIRITDPLSGAIYVVEYRTAQGLDATSNEFTLAARGQDLPENHKLFHFGADPAVGSVRILREIPFTGKQDAGLGGERTYTETTALAVSPVSGRANWRSPRIDAGQTFVSMNSGFTVRVDSVDPAIGAAVTVAFPAHTPVSAAISASHTKKQVYGARAASRVVLRAEFRTPDGAVVPAGRATFYDGTKAVASVPVVKGVAKHRLAATTTAGRHKYSVAYRANDSFTAARSASVTVKVAPARSVVRIALTRKSVPSGTKAKVRVTVKVSGVTKPTGKLVAYANGKKLTSYGLSASRKGSVTITLPTISRVGTSRIYVKYIGTKNIANDNSVKKSLQIIS